jgi:hypothetical protein
MYEHYQRQSPFHSYRQSPYRQSPYTRSSDRFMYGPSASPRIVNKSSPVRASPFINATNSSFKSPSWSVQATQEPTLQTPPKIVNETDVSIRVRQTKRRKKGGKQVGLEIAADGAKAIADFINLYLYVRINLMLPKTQNGKRQKQQFSFKDIEAIAVFSPDTANASRLKQVRVLTPLKINELIIANGIRSVAENGKFLVCIDGGIMKTRLEMGYNIKVTDFESGLFMAAVCEYLISELATTAYKHRNAVRSELPVSKEDVLQALQKDPELSLIQTHMREKRDLEKKHIVNAFKTKQQAEMHETGLSWQYTAGKRDSPFYLASPNNINNASKRTVIPMRDLAVISRERSPEDIYYKNFKSIAHIFETDMWSNEEVKELSTDLFGGIHEAADVIRNLPDNKLGYNISNDQFVLTFTRGGPKNGTKLKRILVYFRISNENSPATIVDVTSTLQNASVANVHKSNKFLWIPMIQHPIAPSPIRPSFRRY